MDLVIFDSLPDEIKFNFMTLLGNYSAFNSNILEHIVRCCVTAVLFRFGNFLSLDSKLHCEPSARSKGSELKLHVDGDERRLGRESVRRRKMAVMKGFLVFILIFLPACFSKPFNTSRTLDPEKANEIKKEKLFLEDHLKGVKLERDGHVNKDYHHEAFLGKMVENGTLLFDNMDGYRRLIDLFHQVDKDGDHLISRPEMIEWIHGKIKEHVQEARENNRRKFKEADKNGDSVVTWNEFQEKLKELNATRKIEVEKELDDVGEPQDPIVEYHDKFRRGDLNMDDKLDETEFLYFEHPEHNPQSIKDLVEDMIQNFDKNQDKVLTKEEFAQLPPGEVDTQQDADLDEDYRKEREDEFVAMDEDGDGVVTVDELTKYLDPTHKQRAINEGNYLVSMADRNRDDQLSEKEVLMNYQLFTGSTMANYAGYLHDEF